MAEEQARVLFQQEVAKAYSDKCPQLTSYIGSQLAITLKKVGVQPLPLCSYCSTPLLPANTSTRILTHHQLKTKRRQLHVRGRDLYSCTQKPYKSHVVIHCKACGRCSAMAGQVRQSRLEEREMLTDIVSPAPHHQTTPHIRSTRHPNMSKSLTTPTTGLTQKKRCGLKAALQQSRTFKRVPTSQFGASPKLSDFLTSLQEQ